MHVISLLRRQRWPEVVGQGDSLRRSREMAATTEARRRPDMCGTFRTRPQSQGRRDDTWRAEVEGWGELGRRAQQVVAQQISDWGADRNMN